MRLSQAFLPTRKEDPADAEVVSHRLLVRAGYIRMIARGIYTFLPLGWRSVRKIEAVVREEMDRAGALEIMMPAVQPAELWEESGRWDEYGPELLRLTDRKGADFCVGPTHEEVVTDLVRGDIKSYKQLPINLYQIQTKFRDEVRPRFGLMRGREFVMKDAYSFDVDIESAETSYQAMFDAYHRIFQRLGFEYRAVEADTGNIGGSTSHEFQVLADTGEDEIVSCSQCGYAANVEKAEIRVDATDREDVELHPTEKVPTPNASSISDVAAFLDKAPQEIVKTLIFQAEETLVAVLLRGDHDANPIKIATYLRDHTDIEVGDLHLATDAAITKATNAPVGFAGPVGLSIPVFADLAIRPLANFTVGANEADTHLLNVNYDRDFQVTAFADLRLAREGDACGRCGGALTSHRGIEVGHVFLLGDKYSRSMEAHFLDQNGRHQPMQMGCYGIGVTRILAAVVEQNHDDDGIIWPMAIAPYHAILTVLHPDNEDVMAIANDYYQQLQDAGVEVLLDDRNAGIGAKFKDADLIGIPLRVTLGARGVKEGQAELKLRHAPDKEFLSIDDVVPRVIDEVHSALHKS